MKIIGLTGSIGMGKTETARIFEELGVPVFDSDAAVHKLMGYGGEAVELVEATFPGVKQDGCIDRELLGKKVFGDDNALKRLEDILHPMVIKKRKEFIKNMKTDLVLFDIPLLFEKGYENEVDYIVVVTAPSDVQKARVLARPNMTVEKFNSILEKQLPDRQKRKKADFVIQTDAGIDYAHKQATEIIEEIRKEMNA